MPLLDALFSAKPGLRANETEVQNFDGEYRELPRVPRGHRANDGSPAHNLGCSVRVHYGHNQAELEERARFRKELAPKQYTRAADILCLTAPPRAFTS